MAITDILHKHSQLIDLERQAEVVAQIGGEKLVDMVFGPGGELQPQADALVSDLIQDGVGAHHLIGGTEYAIARGVLQVAQMRAGLPIQ